MDEIDPLTRPELALKRALRKIRRQIKLYGPDLLVRASDCQNLYEHLMDEHAGVKFPLPAGLNPYDAILFEWRRNMPTGSVHYEIVLFSVAGKAFRKQEIVYCGNKGAITVATLHEVPSSGLLSYARVYPKFAEFVHERCEVVFSRIKKIKNATR
ncbi:MAG TPA: hypothetical protein VL335_01015 [Candidatus Paceibacterota bacterium]|jgi:hypothetical protein|nr:hypothetical protein [Candidatus Paceibacterota bacterium]